MLLREYVSVCTISAKHPVKCCFNALYAECSFLAVDSGTVDALRACPAPERLDLKLAAQCMLLKNLDADRGRECLLSLV